MIKEFDGSFLNEWKGKWSFSTKAKWWSDKALIIFGDARIFEPAPPISPKYLIIFIQRLHKTVLHFHRATSCRLSRTAVQSGVSMKTSYINDVEIYRPILTRAGQEDLVFQIGHDLKYLLSGDLKHGGVIFCAGCVKRQRFHKFSKFMGGYLEGIKDLRFVDIIKIVNLLLSWHERWYHLYTDFRFVTFTHDFWTFNISENVDEQCV